MEKFLPHLKAAVTRFIDELRPTDLVAIYSFSNSLRVLQDFTSERSAAKRAVMRTRAGGGTALFDAIAQTVGAISRRNGRKALVVFTDGADNSSVLDSQAAAGRAKRAGIPVFAVAQGAARHWTLLAKLLSDISTATGGATFEAGRIQAIDKVFSTISTRLLHLYMVGYTAPAPEDDAWRTITVHIKVNHKYQVRAREGYFPV